MSERLLVVVGPTASGKTDLAIRLAEALDGEIVSADSVQVYRYFDLGTGKPSGEQRARAAHHLIDVVEPDDPMDAARWAELADAAISQIRARGRTPIVCGGTFLWVKALLFGLAAAPPADSAVRARHAEWAEREGRAALHRALQGVDPSTAARLSPNDFVRVSRALEVHELTGLALSSWQDRHAFRTVRHAARLLGIGHERDALDARIRARALAMLGAGFVAEVRELSARGFGATRPMGSVGYKQIAHALAAGGPSDQTALQDEIVRATRVFARRQRTWLRDQPVRWLEAGLALEAPRTKLLAELG
jgi:tRNA dimethylallyltransferase